MLERLASTYLPLTPLILLLASFTVHANERTAYVLGALAIHGHEDAVNRFKPTADYLTHALHEKVTLRTLTLDQMDTAVKNGELDFITTNTANFVTLQAKYGIAHIATMIKKSGDLAYDHFGAVIFTRKDSGIHSLEQLRGKEFIAVHKIAFGGWWMAWRELKKERINPAKEFKTLKFTGFPQDKVVDAVVRGKADAGTVRTGVLERMAAEHKIDLNKIRILNPQRHTNFMLAHSTPLYPEWPFAIAPHVDNQTAKKIVHALFVLPPGSKVLEAARLHAWTVPLNYKPVHELMKELEVDPYAPRSPSWHDLMNKFWVEISIGLTFLCVMLAIAYIRKRQATQLLAATKEKLAKANEEYEAANKEMRSVLKTKTKFIRNINDSLKVPINRILAVSLIAQHKLEAEGVDMGDVFNTIRDSVVDFSGGVTDLLYTFVISDGEDTTNITTFDVAVMLEDLRDNMESIVHTSGNKIEYICCDKVNTISSDYMKLQKALKHLVKNANDVTINGVIGIKATLSISSDCDILEIAITDQGNRGCHPASGLMGPTLLANSAINSARRKDVTSLYLCRKIIERLGGVLLISQGYRKHTEVKIQLPIHPMPSDT